MTGLRMIIGAAICAALPAFAQDLPSGQAVTLHDSLLEVQPANNEIWLVLRYLAPAIQQGADGALTYADVAKDMDELCLYDGMEALSRTEANVAQIVIVLMDQPVERGIPNPDVTQFISAYLPTDAGCIWQ
jgi:hypothetical protein